MEEGGGDELDGREGKGGPKVTGACAVRVLTENWGATGLQPYQSRPDRNNPFGLPAPPPCKQLFAITVTGFS